MVEKEGQMNESVLDEVVRNLLNGVRFCCRRLHWWEYSKQIVLRQCLDLLQFHRLRLIFFHRNLLIFFPRQFDVEQNDDAKHDSFFCCF